MDVITHIPAWGNSAQNAASLRKQQLENTVPPVAPANNSLLIDSRVTPDRVRPAAHHNRAQWEVVMGWIFIPTHPAGWRGDVAWRPSDPPRNLSQWTVKGGLCGAHLPPTTLHTKGETLQLPSNTDSVLPYSVFGEGFQAGTYSALFDLV